MDNFSVFNKESLSSVIEPFLPGATGYITPIAYQAWTPDIFLFLFRVGINGEEHFFVSLTFDHLSNGKETAAGIVEQWDDHEIDVFIDPDEDGEIKIDYSDGSVWLGQIYKAYMIEVKRPKKLGYWSSYITISKDTDLNDVSLGLSDSDCKEIKSLLAKNKDYVINVYKNDLGEAEFFYNM